MHLYKLSPTRAIATYARYSNPLYSGSSYNRKYEKLAKEKEQAKAKQIAIQESEEAQRYFISRNSKGFVSVVSKELEPQDTQAGDSIPGDPGGDTSNPAPTSPRSRYKTMSARTKYKIRDKIEALYSASDGQRFTFLTLTFINKVDDKTAQKCLNKFLTVCRKHFGKFLYIWVAEKQNENKYYPGNIHFHLITNKFFQIQKFNALWVLQQYNAGIVHEKYELADVLQHSLNGTMQDILNPVDVKPITSIDGLSIYLTMYVTKNTDTFQCLTWHCCRTVSKLFTSMLCTKSTFEETRQLQINFAVNTKTGEVYEPKVYVHEYGMVVNILNKEHFRKKLTDVHQINSWILNPELSKMSDDDFSSLPYVDYLTLNNVFLS